MVVSRRFSPPSPLGIDVWSSLLSSRFAPRPPSHLLPEGQIVQEGLEFAWIPRADGVHEFALIAVYLALHARLTPFLVLPHFLLPLLLVLPKFPPAKGGY